MNMIVIPVESEIELQRILEALDSKDISYTVKKYDDTSFPSIGQVRPYAEISVDEGYQETVNVITNELLSKSPILREPIKAKSKLNKWLLFLVAYSLVVSVVAFRYWYIHNRSSVDKNFEFHWNYDGTQLTLVNKATGKDGSLYIDDNLNYSFEEIITYSDSGTMVTKSIDENENGRYEKFLNYNLAGATVIRMIDLDDDGVIDQLDVVLQNGDALTLIADKEGFFEVKK